MWRLRKPSASRGVLRRISTLLATPLIVASFLTVFVSSTPVFAVTAEWDGPVLNYDGNQYTKDDSANLPAGSHQGDIPYIWIDQSSLPQKAYVIFFDTDQPQEEDDAELVTYSYTPPDTYVGPSSPQTIEVTIDPTGGPVDIGDVPLTTCDSSIMSGVGWILCPISNWIADGVDAMYRIVNDFLEVPVVTSDSSSGIYQLWSVLLAIANVCFAFVFIVIIYSHLTSAGFSNYNIKVMLPRLLIAAVLVNISFWLCALAIDISNLLGHSINNVFINIRENMPTGAQVDWSALNAFIMSAGTVGAIVGFGAAAGGSWAGLGFLLIAALAGVAFAIFVAFVILAARQAIITVLLILSPLAFVAFVLPSTQEWFTKWRKSFTTLLMLFPIFAVLFGGSGVAGAAIMNAADGHLHILLIGMATQVIPLVLTPLLIQFSSGLLGRIAGMANNSSRGLADRTKNWAHDNADSHANEKRAKWANMADSGNKRRFTNPAAMMGARLDKNKRLRDKRKSLNDEYLGNRAEKAWQQRLHNGNSMTETPTGISPNAFRGRADQRFSQRYMDSHDLHKVADLHKDSLDKQADKHWEATLDIKDKAHFDRERFNLKVQTGRDEDAAQLSKERFQAAYTEMKAGHNPGIMGPLSEEEQRSIDDIAVTAMNLSHEGSRKGRAEKQLLSNIATELKTDLTKRELAGGIDPHGATKVYAQAIKAASTEHMENVNAQESVFSNDGYTVQELMNVIESRKMRGGQAGEANDYHVHAAVNQVLLSKGNNWSAQKVADFIATQGVNYNEKTGVYTDNKGITLTDSEVSDRRDLQQIFKEAYAKSPLKVSTISGTDLGNMEVGQYIAKPDGTPKSYDATIRDMKTDKFKEDRWITEDVDVLQRYVQILRDNKARTDIGKDQRGKLATQIRAALDNPLNKSKVNGREGQLLQVIEKYLDDSVSKASPSDRNTIEGRYEFREHLPDGTVRKEERKTTLKAPKTYTIDNLFD